MPDSILHQIRDIPIEYGACRKNNRTLSAPCLGSPIIHSMDRHTQLRLYAHVNFLCWPWLWWQLFKLSQWSECSGRSILLSVDYWGNVYCDLIGDDPAQSAPWTPASPLVRPWNPYSGGCKSLARLGAGLAIDPTRTGDQTALAAWLLSYCGRTRTAPTFYGVMDAGSIAAGQVAVKAPP